MIVADSFQLMLRAVAKPFSSLLLLAHRCHHLATPLDTATASFVAETGAHQVSAWLFFTTRVGLSYTQGKSSDQLQ